MTNALPGDLSSVGLNGKKAISGMPAWMRIGSAASAATSTPWIAATTSFSTNWLAQLTDDSGVMSVLHVSAFKG